MEGANIYTCLNGLFNEIMKDTLKIRIKNENNGLST